MLKSSKSTRSRVSAGLMMFRGKKVRHWKYYSFIRRPFFAEKDDGTWTIPKGEASPGEDLRMRAQIEFEEELGVRSHGDLIPLDFVKQKGGKIVHAWAFEGDLPESSELTSNLFEVE